MTRDWDKWEEERRIAMEAYQANPWRPEEYCPHCGADLVGDPIPIENWEHYSPPFYFYRRISIYHLRQDRTVEWMCPDCEGKWPRK